MSNARSVNSLVTFRNSQGSEARGTLLKLTRTTLIFEVYNPYSIIQLSEVLQDLQIRRGEGVIYQGRAIVSNLVNTGLMLIVSTTLPDPWLSPAEAADVPGLAAEAEHFVSGWRAAHELRPGYQLAVSRIRGFLTELHRWLEQVEMELEDSPAPVDESVLMEPLLTPLAELFARFEEEAARVPDEERVKHTRHVHQELHPLVMSSPFPHRSFHKPLGYAGDYEMVNMMLREPLEGPNLYARLVNAFFLARGPAEAHRNRIEILVERLTQACRRAHAAGRRLRVLNIACGPAVELQRLIAAEPLVSHAEFWLLDFSDVTLNHTRERLGAAAVASGHAPRVNFIQQSVHTLIKAMPETPAPDAPDRFDLVYCAGLFDYLSDRVCRRLLRLFHDWTEPGGLVLATNVDPSNTARFLMEDILEWHLVYRNAADMLQLVPGLGQQEVYADDTGQNVFLEISRV